MTRATSSPTAWWLASSLLLALLGGCAAQHETQEPTRNTVTIVPARCGQVGVCVLGHVTVAGTTAPVAKATVFLEREQREGEPEALRLYALTDELGVFIFEEPPPGNYRLAVYKEDSSIELGGLELGAPGVTLLPVRLALDARAGDSAR